MSAMKCFLKWGEEPIIVIAPARDIICFSIMSFLCHRETLGRGCAHGIHRFPSFLPCELLIPFPSISQRYPTAFNKAAIIKPWFFTQVSTISNWQKKKKKLFLKEAQEHKKHTNSKRTRINRDSLFATLGMCDVGVLYAISTFHPHFADLNRHCACCSSCCHSNISIYPVRQLYK